MAREQVPMAILCIVHVDIPFPLKNGQNFPADLTLFRVRQQFGCTCNRHKGIPW